MPSGRPVVPIVLSDAEKSQLLSIVGYRSSGQGMVQRARIVLAAAEGLSNFR